MKLTLINFITFTGLLLPQSDLAKTESLCENWFSYQDKKCFMIVDDTLRSFEDAQNSCQNLESDDNEVANSQHPRLLRIESQEEQIYFENYFFKTRKIVENVWLGARFSNGTYQWLDGTRFNFTNWDSRAPRNLDGYCVSMESDERTLGKWYDEPCAKKNLVVCQKSPTTWTPKQLHDELLEERKQREEADLRIIHDFGTSSTVEHEERIKTEAKLTSDLEKANKAIAAFEGRLNELSQKVHQLEIESKKATIPIGFTYVQLPSERSPSEIWPNMKWSDVSEQYSGLFFRVSGKEAAEWGKIQDASAPKVTRMQSRDANFTHNYLPGKGSWANFHSGAWSDEMYSGDEVTSNWRVAYLKFFTTNDEVRPRNMAMRVWRRVG